MKYHHTESRDAAEIAAELSQAFGNDARALIVFHSPDIDEVGLGAALDAAFADVPRIACSTAGEISTQRFTQGGVSACAFVDAEVSAVAASLADFRETDVATGTARAVGELEEALGSRLRDLDPERHVGIVLIDCVHGVEDATHVALANAAPFLTFVGASAADNLGFQRTTQYANGATTDHGAALMVLRLDVPFRLIKTQCFKSSGVTFEANRVDRRVVRELGGRPAAVAYGEAIGVAPEALDFGSTFARPLGVMIDGVPWVRQPAPPFNVEGSLQMGCEIPEGSEVHVLEPEGDLPSGLTNVISGLNAELGEIGGALFFDCALRLGALQGAGQVDEYRELIDFPACGFHTHGETYLGFMHQTLTALFVGPTGS